jgi:uncharacterized membrane protein
MTALIIGIILFGGSHLFSMLLPGLRDGLKSSWGEGGFKAAYGIIGLVGLGLMIYGFHSEWAAALAAAPAYEPPAWGRHVTMLLVLLGLILLGAAHGKGYLKLWVKNPMSLGVSLWAVGHLLANGRVIDILMFGTFLVIGVLDIILSTARGKAPSHEPRLRSDIVAVIVGLVFYAVLLLGFHPYILGLPVL